MRNKGFTLVELLITVVVLGIIMGLAFPVIRQIQLQNEKKKYETYAEGLMASARLYVDSYDEDMFGHHDTGCAYITYQQLLERNLIKDVPIADRSCNSGQTFVRVVKLKNQYGYSYSLGCGEKENNKAKDVNLLLPEEGVHEMDTSVCRGREGSNIKVSAKAEDNFSRRKKAQVVLESPTGIHGNVVIFATWVKGEGRPNDSSEWSRVNFEIPGKQEETILGGDIITVESEDVVSPAGDGDYYLWIRVDELKDMFGEEWKNPNEEEGNYVHAGPFRLDNTAPVCTYSGEVEENAWSKGTRTITIGCQDKGEGASGCKEGKSEKTFTFNETISKGTASYTIYDNAGNSRKCERNDIRLYLDNTPPGCTLTGQSAAWTGGNRTITWGCNDAHSGCAAGYSGGSKVFNTTTRTTNIGTYEIRDKVGNKRTCPAQNNINVYVDKTAPTCTNSGDSTTWTTGSRTITWGCRDNESGCDPNASGGSKVFNATTLTATIPAYTIKDKVGNQRTCPARTANVYVSKAFVYNYTGGVQTFTVPYTGTYKIEAWGAQGGNVANCGGGRGAYVYGNIKLNAGTTLYVVVGGQPTNINGGYNGGGSAAYDRVNSPTGYERGGGGATDIRLVNGNLYSRIMVAGGGGGTGWNNDSAGVYGSDCKSGWGAGLVNGLGGKYPDNDVNSVYNDAKPSTQTAAGYSICNHRGDNTARGRGSFGVGGNAYQTPYIWNNNGYVDTIIHTSGGGGGGYWGGAGGCSGSYVAELGTGGGGSSFVSGQTGYIAVASSSSTSPKCASGSSVACATHYSGYVFTSAGGTQATNTGNGKAHITLIGE